MIKIIKCNPLMDIDEYNMLQEIDNGENGFMNSVQGMTFDEYKKWLIDQENHHNGNNLPTGWIPYTTYILYDNNIPIGIGRIRHGTNEYLQNVLGAGQIGYGIAKSFRNKGYGSILFKELLKLCNERGYDKITLYPYKNNNPTIRIMLKYNGKIIKDFNEEKIIIEIPTIKE